MIRKKTPYRIENWVCNALSLVSLFGSGLAPFHKRIYLVSILKRGVGFPFYNHLDSGFHSIVYYLLEALRMRLGFHFIGVEGEVSVGNSIVNTV